MYIENEWNDVRIRLLRENCTMECASRLPCLRSDGSNVPCSLAGVRNTCGQALVQCRRQHFTNRHRHRHRSPLYSSFLICRDIILIMGNYAIFRLNAISILFPHFLITIFSILVAAVRAELEMIAELETGSNRTIIYSIFIDIGKNNWIPTKREPQKINMEINLSGDDGRQLLASPIKKKYLNLRCMWIFSCCCSGDSANAGFNRFFFFHVCKKATKTVEFLCKFGTFLIFIGRDIHFSVLFHKTMCHQIDKKNIFVNLAGIRQCKRCIGEGKGTHKIDIIRNMRVIASVWRVPLKSTDW